jgi:hypothetical protein
LAAKLFKYGACPDLCRFFRYCFGGFTAFNFAAPLPCHTMRRGLKTRRRRIIEAENQAIDTYTGKAAIPAPANLRRRKDVTHAGERRRVIEAANEAMIPAPAKLFNYTLTD